MYEQSLSKGDRSGSHITSCGWWCVCVLVMYLLAYVCVFIKVDCGLFAVCFFMGWV